MNKKVALITGVSGQDAFYMANLLHTKGYTVYGMLRGQDNPRRKSVETNLPFVRIVEGDLLDPTSLINVVQKTNPDEIYNLGAISFVPISWTQPVLTMETTGLGVLRLLEAIKTINPTIKLFQAGSSEQYGKVRETPQTELTPFYPRSPYGVAKCTAFELVRNYRESYGIYCCTGISFNHECVLPNTPVIIRKNGMVDIVRIDDIVPHRESISDGVNKYTSMPNNLEVWDRNKWSNVLVMTATRKHDANINKILVRTGYISTTSDHILFKDNKEIKACDIQEGDFIDIGVMPSDPSHTYMSKIEARFLGLIVGDGYFSSDGVGRFTNKDEDLLNEASKLWVMLSGGNSRYDKSKKSGFTGEIIPSIEFNGNSSYGKYIRSMIYNEHGEKRVPKLIINSEIDIILSFLDGYNDADGLKAGHCTYKFKNFKTSSATLALGLWYLISISTRQRCILNIDNGKYYSININCDDTNFGKHLQKSDNEVKNNISDKYTGWVFDLATDSGTFSAGVGLTWIHNSQIRPPMFVTRKISQGAAKIKAGLLDSIKLGNIRAKRDWGYSGDYVEAYWKMLQASNPDDYVIATNETHSIQEFCEEAFNLVNLDWTEYVKIDDSLVRPAEVDILQGDYTKIKNALGWEPAIKFKALVKLMVEYDIALLENK